MIALLLSFGVTLVLTPLVIAAARRFGWVARPRDDRWHATPTALMGGIAIFAGVSAAWLSGIGSSAVAPLLGPAAAIFILGWVDDRLLLRPHLKLIGQIAAAAWVVHNGVVFGGLPYAVAGVVTLFWIVGITNALNLLDNMDGLAAGVTAIASLTLAIHSVGNGDAATATAALGVVGACAGFLVFNFKPAKIFMGDCGSMFLGFSLATLSIQGLPRSAPNVLLSLVLPVLVLAIPIFDTTLVTVARLFHGRKISQGGRDHSSHRLFALGLSERTTVLLLYALTGVSGAVALSAGHLPIQATLMLAGLLFVVLLGLGVYLGVLKVYEDETHVPREARPLVWSYLYKTNFVQVLLDALLVPLAFGGAHLLRFEGAIPVEIKEAVLRALPVLWVAKLVSLALCKAYRGDWRYAGLTDAFAGILGSTTGTAIAVAVLSMTTGLRGVSRAALVLDWLLFTLLVVGARTWFGLFRHLFSLIPARSGLQVVFLGVGPEAFARAQALQDPLAPRRGKVLGLLDERTGWEGRTLNGIPVLGSLERLPELLGDEENLICVLGVGSSTDTGRHILAFCARHDIDVYENLDALPYAGENRHGGPSRPPSHAPTIP